MDQVEENSNIECNASSLEAFGLQKLSTHDKTLLILCKTKQGHCIEGYENFAFVFILLDPCFTLSCKLYVV
jgi:hypothetical protein